MIAKWQGGSSNRKAQWIHRLAAGHPAPHLFSACFRLRISLTAGLSVAVLDMLFGLADAAAKDLN